MISNDKVVKELNQIRRKKIVVDSEIYVEFMKELLNSIKTKVSITKFDVVFLGGGSLVLKNVIETIDSVAIHNEPIYGSLLGASVVCKELMKQ